MSSTMLVCGIATPFSRALIDAGSQRNITSASLFIGHADLAASEAANIEIVGQSPIAIRAAVLLASTHLDTIDAAVLCCHPQLEGRPFHLTRATEIEGTVDSVLTTNLFLLRELIIYFEQIGQGQLTVIFERITTDNLLVTVINEALRNCIGELERAYRRSPFRLQIISAPAEPTPANTELLLNRIIPSGERKSVRRIGINTLRNSLMRSATTK